MWECGLKHNGLYERNVADVSLLMWECGLKHRIRRSKEGKEPSLLMWECGLKQQRRIKAIPCVVTPYVGVWIETYDNIRLPPVILVTPYVGVWIETERDEIDRLA